MEWFQIFIRRWLIPSLTILENLFLIDLGWMRSSQSLLEDDHDGLTTHFLLIGIDQDVALCDGNKSRGLEDFNLSFFIRF